MTRTNPAAAPAIPTHAGHRPVPAAGCRPAPLHGGRRGVTLVEMLVTVALLVLVMTILVQVFASATDALSAQRAFSVIDQDLQRIESQLRLDLEGRGGVGGITADMDPYSASVSPSEQVGADPKKERGYFVYGENSLADVQGEDTDDYLAFTAQAPPGNPFSGYAVVSTFNTTASSSYGSVIGYNRVPITSDKAEIVYFLRNGNLYRRVFLIIDDARKDSPAFAPVGSRAGTYLMLPGGGYRLAGDFPSLGTYRSDSSSASRLYEMPVSWAGFNDISARPSAFPVSPIMGGSGFTYPSLVGTPALPAGYGAEPLATYRPIFNSLADLTDRHNRAFNPRFVENNDFLDAARGLNIPDGLPDDLDYTSLGGSPPDGIYDYVPTLFPGALTNTNAGGAVFIDTPPAGLVPNDIQYQRLRFPYVYPNAFSKADATSTFSAIRLNPLNNHAPQDMGDPLGFPDITDPTQLQTWWGFPTKKEQMSPYWTDPVRRLNDPNTTIARPPGDPTGGDGTPAFYLSPPVVAHDPMTAETPFYQSLMLRAAAEGGSAAAAALPPMAGAVASRLRGGLGVQPASDGAGSTANVYTNTGPDHAFNYETWQALPEEDLILSNVRSFDIKALEVIDYEPDPAQTGLPALPPTTRYVDLGYGLFGDTTPPRLNSGIDINGSGGPDYYVVTLKTFAHEGRMPPLTTDNRADAQWPGIRTNIGEDSASTVRLQRVWDSWSQTYSRANPPDTPLDPSMRPPFAVPPLVSYPAPYPAPLRGLQVQIRVVDPGNERMKSLTLRFDFSRNLFRD